MDDFQDSGDLQGVSLYGAHKDLDVPKLLDQAGKLRAELVPFLDLSLATGGLDKQQLCLSIQGGFVGGCSLQVLL